uniref:Viral late gene transcription factor 3 zinc ribbon domain-containing protein n=1 Tax=Picea sitchensis TaxID=3332 RepID=A9NXE8_PICSI|nr:unknown [Picea sitchensis]
MEHKISSSLISVIDFKNSTKNRLSSREKSLLGKCPPTRKVSTARALTVNEAVSVAEPISSELSWQTTAGAMAGVMPFIVAGIEFSKRIIAQKKCSVCKGSGLVQREKYFFRCYSCGGFLPWQSWKRFFSG